MKILHVVPTYLPATRYGGPIYSVHGLCSALARNGHDVEVFTTNVDGPGVSGVPVARPVVLDGVRVTYFGTALGRRIYRSPMMGGELARRVRDFNVVHLHSVFLWPTAAAAAIARKAHVPYVLSPRGMLVPELIQRKSRLLKTAWITLFERRNLAGAASVHVTAGLEARDLARLALKPKRIDVIPNGFDLPHVARLSSRARSQNKCPTVLCLGRISWKKGLDRLIAAMVHVPDCHLQIAGNDEEGYTGQLRALARQLRLEERISFVGPVEGQMKWDMLVGADVFALASYSENFGNAVLEAMACGVPVVITPEVGLADTVARSQAGLVVSGSPQPFGDAIAHLIADPELRHRMGQAGQWAAKEQFSWAAVAAQTEKLYQDLGA